MNFCPLPLQWMELYCGCTQMPSNIIHNSETTDVSMIHEVCGSNWDTGNNQSVQNTVAQTNKQKTQYQRPRKKTGPFFLRGLFWIYQMENY